MDDVPEKVDICGLNFWEIGLTVLDEEGVQFLLALEPAHKVMDVDTAEVLWVHHVVEFQKIMIVKVVPEL